MLRKLTPKHRKMIRDLATGRNPAEIAEELDVSADTINRLKREDPLFKSALYALEMQIERRLVESEERLSIMNRLDLVAESAVTLCHDVIAGAEEAPLELRLKSAWDVLDRTGNKAVDKKLIGVTNIADVVVAAYNAKYGKTENLKDAKPGQIDI